MSDVTNVILKYPVSAYKNGEERQLKEVNKFFGDDKGFVSVEDGSLPRGWYGGTKYLEVELAIGAFNYLNLEGLIRHLKNNVKWEDREGIQLIFQGQQDEYMSIENIY